MNTLLRFLTLLALPALVTAHPGHESPGWFGGLLHPLVGFDNPLGIVAWLVGALIAAWILHRCAVWCAGQMVALARWLGSSLRATARGVAIQRADWIATSLRSSQRRAECTPTDEKT